MFKSDRFAFVLMLAVLSSAALGADASAEAPEKSFLAMADILAANTAEEAAVEPEAIAGEPAEEATEGPPLPFHCIDGYSGAPITPMAYLCNTGPAGSVCGKPSAAYTFVNLGSKKLHVVTVTQALFGRVELGYAFQSLDVGSLDDDVAAAGLNMGRETVRLHQFNVRVNVLPEDSFDLPLPAVTAGAHFKYNADIKGIDRNLGGAITALGLKKSNGVDYTLTATKMLPKLAFGRPVILTAGLRLSKAAQLGLLGFGGDCQATVEGSVAVLALDNLCLAYEFRGKENPYNTLGTLIGDEDNWHALSASYVVNENITVTGVWGMLGNIVNADTNCALAVQLKYEL